MKPDILALDFDGVICDGLIEYFQTAWKAYCRIWNPRPQTAPPGLDQRFYRLRPVVETGWEMPVLLRSLLLGSTDEEILADWQAIAHQRVDVEELDPADLARAVDGVRDEWIEDDPDGWLSQHRFYPGVVERLRRAIASVPQTVIISTKEGRFIQQLLQRERLDWSAEKIFGKEVRQPKHETLRQLSATWTHESGHSPQIWFVEDRLKTLQSVRSHVDLEHVQSFLADWGYNTEPDRDTAQADASIRLMSLEMFSQDFSAWVEG